jgi:5-formyltetrahydrofolate cyclo-ligase
MNADSHSAKAELRRQLRLAINGLSDAERQAASARARDLLRRQPVWRRARVVLFYAPMARELDVSPLLQEALQQGKTVALPRFEPQTGIYLAAQVSRLEGDCVPGQLGIAEPAAHCPAVELKRLDLVLVPGLGFDLSGHRLGRGRGYYDRLLAGTAGAKCGVAFDPQVVAQIPAERHDVNMNFILTPTRWLEFSTQPPLPA